jgi:hypothetical protein
MENLIGQKPPWDKYTFFTLVKTDNEYWYAYIPMIDVTIRSVKTTDIIDKQWKGRKYEEV